MQNDISPASIRHRVVGSDVSGIILTRALLLLSTWGGGGGAETTLVEGKQFLSCFSINRSPLNMQGRPVPFHTECVLD